MCTLQKCVCNSKKGKVEERPVYDSHLSVPQHVLPIFKHKIWQQSNVIVEPLEGVYQEKMGLSVCSVFKFSPY